MGTLDGRRPAWLRKGASDTYAYGLSFVNPPLSFVNPPPSTATPTPSAPGTAPLLSQVSAYSLLAGTVALPALLTYYDNGLQYIQYAATARSLAARLYQQLRGRTSPFPHPASQASTTPLARPPPPPPRRKLPFAAAAAAAAFLRAGPRKSPRWRGFGARPLPRPTAAWEGQVKV
jgi:hypothetical protein